VSSLSPEVLRILEEQGIRLPEQKSPDQVADEVLQELGISLPKREAEGLDIFQPVRTAFGATQGVGGSALGAIAPQEYAAARAELEKGLGVTPTSPWYEKVEASPGLGDVAAQFVPQSVREGLVGKAIGPIGRLAGNIIGDPTTYTPFVLGKASRAILGGVPEAASVLERAREAERVRQAALGAAPLAEGAIGPGLTRSLAEAARAREIAEASTAFMRGASPLQRGALTAAETFRTAEPIAMGSAAALAYGPAAVRGAYEGWKEAASGITEQPVAETAAETANALLQTGLSAMMAGGLISAADAARTWKTHLAEQRPADARAGIEQVGGIVSEVAARAPGEAPTEPIPSTPRPVEAPPAGPIQPGIIEPPRTEPQPTEPAVVARPPEAPVEVSPGGVEPTPQRAEPILPGEPPPRPPEAPPEVVAAPRPPEPPPAPPAVARAAEPTVPTETAPGGVKEPAAGVVQGEPVRAPLPLEGAPPAKSVLELSVEDQMRSEPGFEAPSKARVFKPEDVDAALGAADDFTAKVPEVGQVLRSMMGFGSRGEKGLRAERAERLEGVLKDPAKRAALDEHLNLMAEDAVAKGEELEPRKVQALLGGIARDGEVPRFESLEGEAPKVAPQKLSRAEVGGKAEEIAAAPAETLRQGKVEAPRAATRDHYDFLKENLGKFKVKSVGELIKDLPLEELKIGSLLPATVREHAAAFREYVAARERGMAAGEAIEHVRNLPQFAKPEGGSRWASAQAARTALNNIFKEVESRKGVSKKVEGAREASPQELSDLADERKVILSGLREAVGKDDKEGIASALAHAQAFYERRKLYDLPKSDKLLMAGLKEAAKKLGVSTAKVNASELIEALSRKVGVAVKELKPIKEAKLEAALPAVRPKPAKPGLAGPGGARALPTHPSRPGHGWYELPNKTQLQHLESEGRVTVTSFDRNNLEGLRSDLEALREDSSVKEIELPRMQRAAYADLLDVREGRLPAFEVNPDSGLLVRMGAKQDKIAEMEAREVYGDVHPSWAQPLTSAKPEVLRDAWTGDAEKVVKSSEGPMLELRAKLKAGGLGDLDLKVKPTLLGKGTYHDVYNLPGTNLVMRVGKGPPFELTRPEQKALVQPTLAQGKLLDHEGMPVYYTVHPKALIGFNGTQTYLVQAVDDVGRLSKILSILEPRMKKAKFDPALELQLEHEMMGNGALPPGRTLQEYFEDIGNLLGKAARADLDISNDVLSYTKKTATPWGLRSEQFGYFPVDSLDTHGVGYVAPGGQAWQLKAVDAGLLLPYGKEAKNHPVLSQVHESNRIAQMATKPESRLTLDEQMRQVAHYVEDGESAVDLGDGLVSANHDRISSEQFVARHGELGGGAARALQGVVDDLAKVINGKLAEGEAPLSVTYRGLTSSPFLSGLYHESGGEAPAHIYSNVVEAVHAAGGDYERGVENLLGTVIHEVAHNKDIGHGSSHQTFQEFTRNHLEAQGKLEEYRAALKAAFPESQFRQVEESLVPEFQRMRRAHGNRAGSSWADASRREAAVEGIPPHDLEGRAPPLTDRLGGGEEGASLDRGLGEEPGGAVPGGGEGQARGIRPATTPEQLAAARPAEGEAAGPAAGRSPLEALKDRIAEYGTREATEEGAKQLLTDMVEGAKRLGTAPSHEDVHNWAYRLAGDLVEVMHPKDLELRANAVRRTPKAGQVLGPINLLHYADLPVKTKARLQVWYDLTKHQGLWPEDRPQRWEDVSREVQEVYGLHTPEQWAMHFRNQQGGPTARDVLLIRQVANELATGVDRAEARMADALAKDPNITPFQVERLQADVNLAHQKAIEGVLGVAQSGQKAGRALAILKNNIRAIDPQLAFQQDLRAVIRERVQTRFKNDPKKADEVANKLFAEFMRIRDQPNPDWREFQNAYRAMLGSKLWPEKILEFYKAGLLGWPSRVANMTSNALLRGVRMVEDAVAAGLDATQSKLTGKAREQYLGEGAVSMLAMRRAWSEAIPEWWQEMKRNMMLQPDDLSKSMAKGSMMEDLLQGSGAIAGKTGEFIRFHLKGMGADDALAKHFVEVDHLYRQIYRKLREGDKNFARKSGESLAQATERIFSDLRGNWQQALDGAPQYDFAKVKLFQPMREAAKEAARRETFQAELGSVGKSGQTFLRNNPFMQIFIPFYRTPVNITKETLARTPLGILNTLRKKDGLSTLQFNQELSRGITGTLLGMGALSYAMADGASGGGPLDPDERAMLESTGWQPYSIKLGNQYVSYQRLEPLASILGVAADSAEGIRSGDFQSARTGMTRVLQSAAENVTNKTFLSGLDALSSAISHPNQFFPSFIKRMQASVIPNSLGFVPVSGLARALDQTYRQSEPFSMSAFYQKLPFLSSTLEPQYGPSGAERTRPGTAIEQVISPFARKVRMEGETQVGAEEVVRLAASPRSPRKYWVAPGGLRVDFLPEERKSMAQAMEEATKYIGQRLIKDPNYLALPDNEMDPKFTFGRRTKETVIKDVYGRYRDKVMQRIKPQLQRRGKQQLSERA
jgi:hypothetical protein